MHKRRLTERYGLLETMSNSVMKSLFWLEVGAATVTFLRPNFHLFSTFQRLSLEITAERYIVKGWCACMGYEAKSIANFFLEKANAEGKAIDPMKLQKLIYFAHGWHLALNDGQPLINEPIEAWPYGPVIRSIYYEFKEFGSNPITRPASEIMQLSTGDLADVPIASPKDSDTVALLEKVWEVYGPLTGIQLANLTHEDGTPWQVAWAERDSSSRSVVIKDDLIKTYFESQAQQ